MESTICILAKQYCETMWHIQTCVCEIDHREEDHAGSKRDSEEEKCLELLSGQPVLQVLQEGIGLEKCKHTWEKPQTETKEWTNIQKGNSHWIFEEAPIHAASCRVQSRLFVVKKRRCQFGRIFHKAVRDSPFGCSCRCERQILRDNIFQMHETDLCE